jgi:uncharacterized protein (TIGR02996 family)
MFAVSPRPELLALLAAVKAEPEDDTPRLALADWLQEQDHDADRARGEFLRTLVEYNRTPPETIEAAELLAKLKKLWEHYHPAWVGPLMTAGFQFPRGHSSSEWGLLRPFINGYQVATRDAKRVAGSEAYAWVGHLDFNGLSSNQLRKFTASRLLDTLIGLRIHHCSVGPGAMGEVVQSSHAAALKYLDLYRVRAPAGAVAHSPHMARLRELRLPYCQVSDGDFKRLCDSPHLNELRSLDVSNNALTIHAARSFADRTGLPALTELNLGGTNRIGPDGTLILVDSPSTGRLRKLNLWSNGVADYGVEAICKYAHVSHLTHLDLSGNLLTNRAAVALAAAEHLKTLEELNLRTNGISGEGALALANSPHLNSLCLLNLVGNTIGQKAAAALRDRFGDRVVLE